MYNRVRKVRGKDAKLLGVCGGLSKYIDPEMDPFIIRLIFVLLAIFSGGFLMLMLYFITALILKVEDPKSEKVEKIIGE